jgi:Flp pilus assembly protein TadB
MLSDADQRRLTEIELALRGDDPRFARRFDARANRWSWRGWRGNAALFAVCLALVAVIVGLVVGSVVTVVVAVTVLGAAAGVWGTRRRGH